MTHLEGTVSHPLVVVDAAIAQDDDTSDGVRVAGFKAGTLYTPATVTSTYLLVEKSQDDGATWSAARDEDGDQLRIPSGSGTLTDGDNYTINPRAFEGATDIRFVGDDTEAAARTFQVGLS